MKTRSILLSVLLPNIFFLSSNIIGQNILTQNTQETPAQVQTDSVVLTPFPVTGITEAFGATGNLITESGKHHLTGKFIETFSAEVDTLFKEVSGFLGDSTTILLEGISVRVMDQISARARVYIGRLDILQGRLSSTALDLESTLAVLLENRTRWQLTLDGQTEEEAVESRTERIGRTLFQIDSVKSILQEDLALILATQDQLGAKKLELQAVVQRVKDKKLVVGENLLTIDMPGFFKDLSNMGDSVLISSHVNTFKTSIRSDYDVLKSGYLKSLVIVAFFLVFLLVFSVWFKHNYQRLISQDEFKISKMHLTIIKSPLVTSIFVITLMVRFFLRDLPQTFAYLNILILMIPTVILMVRLFGKVIRTWIIVLAIIYMMVFLSELAYTQGPLVRVNLMGICFAGLWLFTWVYRKKAFFEGFRNKGIRSLFRGLMILFAGLHFIAIIANLVGAFQLAEFITILPINVTILAIVIQLASKLADVIIYLALSSNRLQRVHVIKDDVEFIHKKTLWLVDLFLWLFAFVVLLRIFLVKDLVFDWGRRVLTESMNIWNIDFSLGNILIFFFVIWLSVMITRIITRILEKDVFTRVTTAKGMPQTIILLLRITLITGGFFLAAGAAGMELTNLTIVLGAFSVGIGFGLQNIFNNMVSGLILAFERPIKVGDIVQVGELMGTVKSIGLRSSNVRSFDGAEVTVPNGNLISNQMINWTKSDNNRRMDIRVGVAYGTDPEEVLKLMEETAAEFTEVRKSPAPRGYFLEFGESSLDFRLLAWVHLDIRLEVESDLKVAINRKLKEAGIQVPFPQRDLHIRSDATRAMTDAKPVRKPKPNTGGTKK
jgi:small-conductance mechanosensitive channel